LRKAQIEYDKFRRSLAEAKSPVEEHFEDAVKHVKKLAKDKPSKPSR